MVVEDAEEVTPAATAEHRARHRVALPVRARGGVAAVLLVAPHPLRPLDEGHRRFLDLLGDQVGQVVSLATARADEQARLEALAAIDAAKSELLSSVSHEFRTPLTLLLGPLEDALDGRAGGLDLATLGAMHQGAHRLLRMVNDLLDIARIDAGGRVVDPEPTDVAGLTEELLEPFRGAAARSGLAFDARIDHAIGAVETDPRLWEKILLNLVSNAVKYTHTGGITVELRADGDEAAAGEHLVLRVADTGVGIAADEVDRVFERFHRASGSVGRSIEGTGLGLALVAEAAHAQGGTAAASSQVGEGSSFEVRLPLARVGAGATVPARGGDRTASAAMAMALELAGELPGSLTGVPAADAARADAPLTMHPPDWLRPEGERPTILVVDDSQAMRSRLERVLGEVGAVVTATDGEQALAVLRHSPVDLVVTDVMMPRLDGVGLLRAIRADESLAPVPVVVLSARAGAEAATHALEIGADDYVVKPFTRTELLARCRASLELARHRAHVSALAARSALVAGVSHDMLTPLAVISSVLETLCEPGLEPDLRVGLSQRALPRAQELERLIRQFLDWSRLSAGKPIATFSSPVDVVPLVTEVVATYPGATLEPGPESATVSCDAPRTQQVLHNLLSNATRAARDTVRVAVRPADDDDDVPGAGPPEAYDVAVTDDGPGVSEHVRPQLFMPYGPSDRTDGGSHGLGLFVSRETARAQGGDLVLESTGEGGSTFVLRLRASRVVRVRVLLADDDEDLRFVVEQLLGRRGWSLTTVANGDQAQSLLTVESFDVLVLDENMPPGSGLEVAEVLREAGDTTPVILFTGMAPTIDADRVDQLGVRLLPKAEVIKLGSVVASVLGADHAPGT